MKRRTIVYEKKSALAYPTGKKEKMSLSLKQVAQNSITLSPLMVDRVAVKTEDIVSKYPNGITVTDFDIVDAVIDSKPAHFAVLTFAEDKTAYYTSGIIITKMIDAFVDECGSINEARANYDADSDKLKLKLEKGYDKSGTKNLTKVTIL